MLPHDDVEFIVREGIDMQHCLASRYTAEDYLRRMQAGEHSVYSLFRLDDGKPEVDIEISWTHSSYGGAVNRPTVTQLRGPRNQCPPDDDTILPLEAWFNTHPDWVVSGHGVRSFDGRVDGDEFAIRLAELKGNKPSQESVARRLVRAILEGGPVGRAFKSSFHKFVPHETAEYYANHFIDAFAPQATDEQRMQVANALLSLKPEGIDPVRVFDAMEDAGLGYARDFESELQRRADVPSPALKPPTKSTESPKAGGAMSIGGIGHSGSGTGGDASRSTGM